MRRKSLVALVAASAVIVPAGVFASSASAATSQSFTKYFLKGGTTPVKGIQVSGFTDSVYFAVTSDVPSRATFKLGSTTGLSLPFGYAYYQGSSIAFTGTQDAVNAALKTLTVTTDDTVTTGFSVKTTAFTSRTDVSFNPQNQHFYKYVPGKITGTNAQFAAGTSIELGLLGYLASITSEDENNFVAGKIQGDSGQVAQNVWIGASDAETEGAWKWVGGPENGVQFWQGCNVANGGAPYEGRFSNWASGEPNNWNASLCQVENSPTLGEDCAIINKYSPTSAPPDNVFFDKQWNDLPCSYGAGNADVVKGYVAEYGNKTDGGDFTSVDFVTSAVTVAVPAAKPTFLDRLFNLFGFKKTSLTKGFKIFVKPKKSQPKQLCPTGPKKTRFSYTLLMGEAGRYSFYFTDAKGKRIPMQCGTVVNKRVITAPISAPVIQSVKESERPVITAYVNSSSVGKISDYPLLNVILRRTDGTLERQDQPSPPLPGTPLR
ncbi:MAG: lectin-like protein [Miltoncostaeaceae bacterium]